MILAKTEEKNRYVAPTTTKLEQTNESPTIQFLTEKNSQFNTYWKKRKSSSITIRPSGKELEAVKVQ